jgi:hypothetical protein
MFFITASEDVSGNTGYSDGTISGLDAFGTTEENIPFGVVNVAMFGTANASQAVTLTAGTAVVGNLTMTGYGGPSGQLQGSVTPGTIGSQMISPLMSWIVDTNANVTFLYISTIGIGGHPTVQSLWTSVTFVGNDGQSHTFNSADASNFTGGIWTFSPNTPIRFTSGQSYTVTWTYPGGTGAGPFQYSVTGRTEAPPQTSFGALTIVGNDDSTSFNLYSDQITAENNNSTQYPTFSQSGLTSTWTWPSPPVGTFTTGFTYTITPNQYPNTQILSAGVLITMQNPDDVAIDDTFETLAQLQQRMMLRLGYGAQVSNPPPGVLALMTDYLQSSQRELFRKWPEKLTRRFFRWTMEPGYRFYDLTANDEVNASQFLLSTSKTIEWVGIQDNKGTWTPLYDGIPPELYTMVTQYGRPQRYEIRNAIEVFPAPDMEYNLWIKAHFKLLRFTQPGDITTIDSEAVFLHALAIAKLHAGQGDADKIMAMATGYVGQLTAATHGTKRYIPGTADSMPIVKPRLLQFVGSDGTP